MDPIHTFIHLVNDRLLSSSQLEPLIQLWKDVPLMMKKQNSIPRCGVKTKNATCIRFSKEGLTTCSLHAPKPEPLPCSFRLTEGVRINQICGKPSMNGITCRRHIPQAKPTISMDDFIHHDHATEVILEAYSP